MTKWEAFCYKSWRIAGVWIAGISMNYKLISKDEHIQEKMDKNMKNGKIVVLDCLQFDEY